MFKVTKGIDAAFRSIRMFCVIVVVGCVGITCFALYRSYEFSKVKDERVLLMPEGKVIEVVASTRKENIGVEARDHVRTFHRLFFTLSPDEKIIESNLIQALYLADITAKQQYDNLKEGGYYSSVISSNVSQQLHIDSVSVSLNDYPFRFRFYGYLEITRPSAIVKKSLITEGLLRSIMPSDNNPHGFLIERWEILDNRDLEIKRR